MYKPFNKVRLSNFKLVLTAFLVASFVIPNVSFAAVRNTTGAPRAKVNFCSAIEAFAEKMKSDMANNEAKFTTKENERKSALEVKFAQQEADRQSTRYTWDSSRDKVYTDLLERADSDAEKAAILKFRTAIDSAVEARRKSVDAATLEFKNAVDKGMKERKAAIEAATAKFRTASDKALVDAKSDCANGIASADARATYVFALESAQKKLQESLSQIKNSDTTRALIKARQNAIEKAAKDFKTAVSAAEDVLKKSFPDA